MSLLRLPRAPSTCDRELNGFVVTLNTTENTTTTPRYEYMTTHCCLRCDSTKKTTFFLQFIVLLLQRLESDAVTDWTPEIWSRVRLKRTEKVGDEEA
ncbi:hypothetical protein J6590_032597 [Homalodisca vitripennis]|nr:hypothetical protein J6590_032597 [Homalodisca vitripennis]